ncbi:hypothetical protein H5410_041772, partial [Solanum commersonii]
MPKDIKKCMWKYINVRTINFEIAFFISKFLIPVEGKKWVMSGLRDAWRQNKQKIKERCFDKNNIVEDMLVKHPDDISEAQFCQLIDVQQKKTTRNHHSLKCLLQLIQRRERKFRPIPKLQYQLLQNNPGLNVQDIPGVVGSNLVSHVDARSVQVVKGQNIPHSSGSTHDSVLQK